MTILRLLNTRRSAGSALNLVTLFVEDESWNATDTRAWVILASFIEISKAGYIHSIPEARHIITNNTQAL